MGGFKPSEHENGKKSDLVSNTGSDVWIGKPGVHLTWWAEAVFGWLHRACLNVKCQVIWLRLSDYQTQVWNFQGLTSVTLVRFLKCIFNVSENFLRIPAHLWMLHNCMNHTGKRLGLSEPLKFLRKHESITTMTLWEPSIVSQLSKYSLKVHSYLVRFPTRSQAGNLSNSYLTCVL